MVAEPVGILQQMDNIPPGPMIAPKALAIIHYVERGKPYMLLDFKVSTSQEEETA